MRKIRINTQPWEKYVQTEKKKDYLLVVCKYKRRMERVEGRYVPKENAEIYTINTPTKTRKKLNSIFFSLASRHRE